MKIIGYLIVLGIVISIFNMGGTTEKEENINITNVEYFNASKKQIMTKMKYYLESKKFQELDNILERYKNVVDSDLEEFKKRVKDKKFETKDERADKILAELKQIPASQFQLNYIKYKQLVEIYPNNKKYIDKMKYYENIKINTEAKEAAEKIFYGIKPTQSGWDGSYTAVKRHLKTTMHNPDSLEFKGCTEVFKQKEGWLVGCQFRGTNGFGAMVLNSKWFTIRQSQVVNVEDSNKYKW